MKKQITFDAKSMVSALDYLKKVMVKNPVVPILENYLLKVDGNVLTISSSDLSTTMAVSIGIENKFDAMFSACLPLESVKYLKKAEGSLTLEYDANSYSIVFSETDGRAKYSGENAEDFPRAPKVEDFLYTLAEGIEKEFKDLLNYVSEDQLRPAMTGINFGLHAKKYYMCATDGHTLKTVNITALDKDNGPETDFILTAKAAKIISESKINGDIKVFRANENEGRASAVRFSFCSPLGLVDITTRVIDEKYPDYWYIIPTESLTQYTFESKVFLKALDKVELFANRTTHQVRLSLNGANKISAENLDFKNEACFVTGGSYQGKEIEIGFNAEFLKKAIKSFGDSVTLEMREPNRCGVIKDEKSLVLVMPVMLATYA